MNISVNRFWAYVIALFSLCAVFSNTIVPINSNDFWWHLSTGEHILSSGMLPETDPFTYTAAEDDPEFPGRPAFMLKQYWLAQVLYALEYKYTGLKGIIVSRGLVFVLIAIFLVAVAKTGADIRSTFILLFLFALATRTAIEDSDRPHVFMFLCSIILVAAVEWSVRTNKKWLVYNGI